MKLLVILLSASVMLAAAPAAAQQRPPTRPERPYRGLFSGGVDDGFEQLLLLNASLGGGYSANVGDDGPGDGSVDPPAGSQSSGFGNISGHLAYSLNRTRVGFNATLGTSGGYYPGGGQDFTAAYNGTVGASFQPARATRINATHATTYQPFLTLNLFPEVSGASLGPTVADPQEFGFIDSEFLSHTSGVAMTQRVFRRLGVSLHYLHHSSDFGGTKRVFSSYGASTGFGFQLARGLGAHVGYAYTRGVYDENGNQPYNNHSFDGGLDFNRAISFSRRTTLSFGTGASAIADRNRTHYRMTGHARLNHEIGRTWYASAGFARSAGFLEAISAPVFSDSVTLAFGGLVNRRVEFQSGAVASSGDFVLVGDGRGFDSYRGWAGVTFGLTRHLGLGVTYSYYRYWFDRGALLLTGVSRQRDRQSVRAHLSMWVPLMHRGRRPDATR